MSSLSRFDFCPKCGALARDGVCQSCGHVNPLSVPKQPEAPVQPQQNWQQPVSSVAPQQNWQQPNMPAYQYQRPQKDNKALITILVIVVIILSLLFTCCAGSLGLYMMDVNVDSLFGEEESVVYPWDEDETEEEYSQPSKEMGDNDAKDPKDATKPTQDLEGLAEGKYYEAPYNALRDDLIYNIEFVKGEYIPEEYEERVSISVEYPQLTGAAPNLDIINAYLEREYSYFYEYFVENYEPNITEDSLFYVAVQGYVTYMDEDILSVVFHEELYIDGESMIQYYCLNFDMTDGVVLNNVDILNLDLEFAVEFRRREILENGDEWLTDFTDQEILDLLRDLDHLVIFYTPMGMEVGLNLYEVVLYMTYSDYEKFLNLY